MPNYTITNQYQSLSTIMGDDYDATKKYRIHNNIKIGELIYALDNTDEGAQIQFADEIYNDVGVDLYLKTNGVSFGPDTNNVYITEVTE